MRCAQFLATAVAAAGLCFPVLAQGDEYFKEALPFLEIEREMGLPSYLAAVTHETYVPPEVVDPAYGDGEPHEAQTLTCFFPTPPGRSDRFPTIVYFTCDSFTEDTTVAPGFLSEALRLGWSVITVGTVGIDSIPTCSQPDRCNEPVGPGFCGNTTAPCYDQSLWFEPDDVDVSSPWNEFN